MQRWTARRKTAQALALRSRIYGEAAAGAPTVSRTRKGSEHHLLFGCIGGHGQAQTQLQVLISMVWEGLDPREEVSRPRWYCPPNDPRVFVDQGVERDVIEGLRTRRHVERLLERYEEIMGHAEVIAVTGNNVAAGAADPRSEGLALGW